MPRTTSRTSLAAPGRHFPAASALLPTTRFAGLCVDGFQSQFQELAQAGCTIGASGPLYVQPNLTASTIGQDTGYDADPPENDGTDLLHYQQHFAWAHDNGIAAGYKPIIDSGDGHDRNYIDPGPSGIDEWMDEYANRLILPYLTNAADPTAVPDVLLIETELDRVVLAYPDHWIDLVERCRATGWKGFITTSAQSLGETGVDAIPWCHVLDWIGSDPYIPQFDYDDPKAACAAWQALLPGMKAVWETTGKPLFFGELGIKPTPTLTESQYDTLLKAFWDVFGPLDYFVGMTWWAENNYQDNPQPPGLLPGLAAGLSEYPVRQ